eukprot:g32327.t1
MVLMPCFLSSSHSSAFCADARKPGQAAEHCAWCCHFLSSPVLAPLQKLQAFAAGNAEKYAAEVFAALHNQGGQAAVDDLLDGLNDAKLIEAVVGKARAQRSSPNAIRVQQEQEAVKLLSHKWKSYQVEEAKRASLKTTRQKKTYTASSHGHYKMIIE